MSGDDSMIDTKAEMMKAARAAADEGMERVDEAAADRWKRLAVRAIRYLVRLKPEGFSTDDVWTLLDDNEVQVHDRRALGPVMRAAQRDELIEPTGDYTPSVRRNCAPLRVWAEPGCRYPAPGIDPDELLAQLDAELIEIGEVASELHDRNNDPRHPFALRGLAHRLESIADRLVELRAEIQEAIE